MPLQMRDCCIQLRSRQALHARGRRQMLTPGLAVVTSQVLAITANSRLKGTYSQPFASNMLRQAARGLCRRGLAARGIRTTAIARQDDEALPKAFTERFVKQVPSTMAPPSFPTDFLPKDAKTVGEAPTTVPDKLTFNFYLPHEQIAKARKVDLVLLPAVTGDFGAMPGHVPTVAQLRPGVVTIHNEMDKDVEKYFVSSGYAFVHADSTTDIVAVEAFKLDELDTDAVRAGLGEYTAKLAQLQGGGKGDDYEIAAAQIGVEVYSAMNAAI